MIHDLKLDKRELRFLRKTAEHEPEQLLAEWGNEAMVYQPLIDKIDGLQLKQP